MTPEPGRVLRALASLLVRGEAAPFVLGDLEETLRRDVASGMSLRRARARHLRNVLASAWSLARRRGRSRRVSAVSWLDVKLGLRMLVKHPLLTTVSVVSLGLGIPAGLVPGLIFDGLEAPLPFEDGDRIRILRYRSLETSGTVAPTTYDAGVWQETLSSFQSLGAVRPVEHNLDSGSGLPAPVIGAEVTGSIFSMLRVRPLRGRTIQADDAAPGAPAVVLIGEDLWRARLAADPEAVGRVVSIGGEPYTVVGVMPSGFGFPERQQMWLPLRDTPAGEPADGIPVEVYGRLADDATAVTADAELEAVLGRLASAFPDAYRRLTAEVAPASFAGQLGLGDGRLRALPQLWLLRVPALVLLLVACANVGLLVFAGAATRSSELAVRTALGASRRRIVAQVFTEALVLSVVSAGVGLLLLHWITSRHLDAVVATLQAEVPFGFDLGLSWKTGLAALALAVVSAAAAALLPALRVTGRSVQHSLQRGGAGGGGIRFGRLSTVLVVADVAVAVAVVGLAVGVADRVGGALLSSTERPFPVEEYLAARVRLPMSIAPFDSGADTSREAHMARVQRELVQRLEADPRVRGVAVASSLPGMNYSRRLVEVESGLHPIDQGWVDVEFFEGLGRPLLAGRDFLAEDLEGDRRAVIVNAAFVQRVLGGASALGKELRYPSDGEDAPRFEIVGVAPDLGMDPLNPRGGAGVYHPVAAGELRAPWLAVHLGPNAASFAPRLRTLAAEVDPTAIVEYPMRLGDSVPGDERTIMVGMLAASALLAAILLGLAASGIYAIMAFTVARRTRELGVRAALGASRGDIVATIGRRAALQIGLGVLLGMPIAGRFYFVSQEDPAATGAAVVAAVLPAVGVMVLLGLIACSGPLLRAMRVLPTEAIRAEG
jgi:predicted permease